MASKKNKLLLISLICIVFVILLVVSGFRLAQLTYIDDKMEGKDVGKAPPHTDEYEKKMTDKCIKNNQDPVSRLLCKTNTVTKNLRIFVGVFLISLIALIVCGVKAIRS